MHCSGPKGSEFLMKESRLGLWTMSLALLFAAGGAFARIMLVLLHSNEDMYIAASVLVAHGKSLYRDFSYLQMPNIPLLYSGIYRVLGIESYYLLTGKIISFVFLMIAAGALFAVTRRPKTDLVVSLSPVAFLLLNGCVVGASAEVSNYIIPVALSILGYYVFVSTMERQTISLVRIALSGLLIGLAIGTKLTYASVAVPFLVMSIMWRPTAEHGRRFGLFILASFLAGMLVALLPTLYYLVSDPKLFIFNNLGYHILNAQWRQVTGFEGPMSLSDKLAFAGYQFSRPDVLMVVVGLILIGFGLSRHRKPTAERPIVKLPGAIWLALMMIAVSVPTALASSPVWYQYFAMPVSFLVLLLACALSRATDDALAVYRRLCVLMVVVSTAFGAQLMVDSTRALRSREGWAGLQIHDASMNIKSEMARRNISGKVATVWPLLAVESNLPIYPQLATGPFLYRIGDMLTPEQRTHFVGTSKKTIAEMLDKDPPAAIVTMVDFCKPENYEAPLVEYATKHNYEKLHVGEFTGEVYIKR